MLYRKNSNLTQVKNILIIFVITLLGGLKGFTQEVKILPAYNPSHIQLKVSTDKRLLSNGGKLYADEKRIEIQAFCAESFENAQLFVPDVSLNLVRNGQRIAGIVGSQAIDISALIALAQEGDLLHLRAKELYIKKNGKNELYTNGGVNLLFTYTDKQIGNAMSAR